MFQAIKGFKKDDLIYVASEIGEEVPANVTISGLKNIILNSEEFKKDPEFVQVLLGNAVAERKLQEEEEKEKEREDKKERMKQDKEFEKIKQDKEFEFEKMKVEAEKEIELARIQAQSRGESVPLNYLPDLSNSKRKFTLPKLEFRQFGDDLKDWLPFWSQFEQVHKDEDIAPEDKFQYLVQATVAGSRAREVVESFPPTGANYEKAIESLKSRFGREDLLVEVYVRQLLKLIISVQIKEMFSLTSLYDKLELYLRALETLGVTTDKCASILYPMVESCFPADFLKAWNRNISHSNTDAKEKLNNLMQFLKKEVEGEERISLAVAGFGLGKSQENKPLKRKQCNFENLKSKVPTAAGLLTATSNREVKKSCVFCDGKHSSSDCFSAQKMSLAEKQKIIKDKRCCFACLSPTHTVKKCRTVLKCVICSKKHFPLMCDVLDSQKRAVEKKEEKSAENDVSMSNFNKRSPKIFLQTVKAKLVSGNKQKTVRLLFDSASHKSYILESVAKEMNYIPIRQEKMVHSLFGGVITNEVKHNCYKVTLKHLKENFGCNFEVLDQSTICENIRPVFKGPWMKELEENEINLTDFGDKCEAIDILVGADVMGKMLTGKRKVLSSGLVALETYLGWTLMGKVPPGKASEENLAMSVLSLYVNEAEISNLWKLDLIGIYDPIEKKSKHETDIQTKEHFLETVAVNREGRYEVCLPWADDKSPLPDNLSLAKKRLEYTTAKLIAMNMYEKYEDVLLNWINEGIIEEVPKNEVNSYGNYLPHRAVIKPSSSTTPIRPVFDASARLANYPSLNQCLECGPNQMELIPDILLRFREKEFGVIADIRKAFLQISIRKDDRDFLRFLWWENLEGKKLKVFRHTRVVFGVKCSPFLLAAVIEYHIRRCNGFEESLKKRLLESFYVDNVVTSVNNKEELDKFIVNSKALMAKGCFDLREWEWSGDCNETSSKKETQVLGLIWNKELDTLKINMKWLDNINMEKLTKRTMLSVVHKVFDPFGFTSPVMLCPKIMLQKAWKLGTSWDEEITGELHKEFMQWFQELKYLSDIQIPRFIRVSSEDLSNCTIHTFVDGSKDAYGAVTFLRVEDANQVNLFLLAAKSRVAPLRGVTIPRMELLAAVIGARLTNSVIEALGWRNVMTHYWSDSTTVLAWIQREENWSVFVRNRVQEIRKLSDPSSWRHITGEKNAADLPSRGCKAKHLVSSKWWEGPQWMKDVSEFRTMMDFSNRDWNEEEIEKEKPRKTCILTNTEAIVDEDWYYRYFSSYDRIIRLVAWILRFKHNCKNLNWRKHGELTAPEIHEAEMKVLLLIQNESFPQEDEKRLKTLQTFKDELGVIRLKTKIIYRKDSEDFLKPIVLPSKHEVVKRLIYKAHVENCHAGVQILLNILREKYWILNGRKAVKNVVASCTACKRFRSKNLEVISPPLPENRVKDAAVFQIIGVDMAGPLFLKDNKKSWVLIFTCAVYRAVHLELVTSASTDAFLMAFRRFTARRGRCSTVYCDNGSNFVGAANYFKKLDWERIRKHGAINSIDWKFNPPTAAWWGGWWERLIRILKDLLKRVLGLARLDYEEMMTVLAECEKVVNSRPLTYICEEEAVKPISPSMFIQDMHECSLPDLDAVEQNFLCKRLKYRQTILKDLRSRFRSEYLGALILRKSKSKKSDKHTVTVGEIVMVGADNKKRIYWPLGRITEIIPGKDGQVRLVKVQTSQKELLRPIQRVYPLEITSSEDLPTPMTLSKVKESDNISKVSDSTTSEQMKFSRVGRRIKVPERLNL